MSRAPICSVLIVIDRLGTGVGLVEHMRANVGSLLAARANA
jgi:hypothetical protein